MARSNEPDIKGLLVLAVAGLTILMAVSYVFFPSILGFTEQREAGEDIVEDTYDAEQAVQDYRWFRQQHNDIEAQRNQIENYYDQRERFYEIHGKDPDEWSRQAEVRHGRINDRITGSQNMLEQMVADYNARSDDATRELFKCNLPYTVDETFYVTGPPGTDTDEPNDQYVDGANPDASPPEPEQCDALPDEAVAE
jgi:hypothetical protein